MAFDLIIDRGQKKLVECYGSSDGIITNEFSEDSISASCPIVGGKRSFKIDGRTGSFTAIEEFVAPPPSREEFVKPASRTYSGACEMSARSQPSVAREEQVPIIRPDDVSDPTPEQMLRDKCEREWPDDFRMRDYCEKQQREGFQTLHDKQDRPALRNGRLRRAAGSEGVREPARRRQPKTVAAGLRPEKSPATGRGFFGRLSDKRKGTARQPKSSARWPM